MAGEDGKTDREVLVEMLKRAGIAFEENEPARLLLVERGYAGFVTTFTFHEDGRLADLEAHE